MGAPGRVFGIGRPVVRESTGGSSQPGVCRRLLCRVAGIRRCYGQRAAPRWDDFVFPIGVRVGIFRLSDGSGGCGRRSFQNASLGSLFDPSGNRRPGGGLFVVDEGVCRLYWPIHCSVETSLGGVSRLVLLYISGMDDLFVLKEGRERERRKGNTVPCQCLWQSTNN